MKSSRSKREQAQELLEVLIPQTVEMNIQHLLASGQLKKKDVKAKRKAMLRQYSTGTGSTGSTDSIEYLNRRSNSLAD